MNAYQMAIARGLNTAIVPESDPARGYTPAEIVAILQTLTVSPIPVARVIHYFDQHNLGAIDPIENAWTGKLVDIARNENMPVELREGLRQLFRHLAKRESEFVDMTDPAIAVQTANLLVVLVQLGAITADELNEFYALDGGRPYLDLSVEQYENQAAEYAIEQQIQADLEDVVADEILHEVLLSVNRGTDGTTRVMARVTPIEFADGVLVRRLQPIVIGNNAELIAALTPIIEGLTQ